MPEKKLVPGLVSVVSAWYNREQWVQDSIASVLAQTYKQLEIVVVDDGSTDGTLRELQSFNDHRLRVLTQENQGFVRAIRRAVSESRGEFVVVLDAGDIATPTLIEKQVDVLRRNGNVGIVGTYVQHLDVDTGRSTISSPSLDPSQPLIRQLIRRNIFSHGGTMYRRSLYDRVGGYREFFKFSQDYDLWLRMSEHAEAEIIPEVLYIRRVFPGGVSVDYRKRVTQAFLAAFAAECARMRLQKGLDPLDKYGTDAVFFRHRSRWLADRLASIALAAVEDKEVVEAYEITRLSVNEKLTLYNGLLWILLWATAEKSVLTADQVERLLHLGRGIVHRTRSLRRAVAKRTWLKAPDRRGNQNQCSTT